MQTNRTKRTLATFVALLFAASSLSVVVHAETKPATPLPKVEAGAPPSPPCVAVLASFPEELEAIEQLLVPDPAKFETTRLNGITFKTAEVAGKRCVFFLTGMSYVNAAANTQLALDRFNVKAVLFTGIAGGVNPAFSPGDVVVPARWHHHGEMGYFNETPPGSGKYDLPGWYKQKGANFGMMFPDHVTVIREGMDRFEMVGSFPADERLLAAAKRATDALPPMKVGDRVCRVSYGGEGVSGTVFCDNAEYRRWVFSTFQADCLDMESTPIAQVCWQNQTPCLIVRGLSDLAGGQTGENQMETFLKAAADHSAAVLVAILRGMDPLPATAAPKEATAR